MQIKEIEQYLVSKAINKNLSKTSADPSEDFPNREEALIELKKLQNKLIHQQEKFYVDRRRKLLIVLQGMDTSGKNSTIRNVFYGVNPQYAHVASFDKPTTKELSYDFLWRVHREVPSNGEIVIFDRSHYEDVLAVRVNKLCPEEIWKKRFNHINNFEQLLHDEGTIIIKLYLHIDKETQKSRLQKRLDVPSKNWKFDHSDLIARSQWKQYEEAYETVFKNTSHPHAPWYIIPSNKKWARNLIVAKIITATLDELHLTYPKVDFNPHEIDIL